MDGEHGLSIADTRLVGTHAKMLGCDLRDGNIGRTTNVERWSEKKVGHDRYLPDRITRMLVNGWCWNEETDLKLRITA